MSLRPNSGSAAAQTYNGPYTGITAGYERAELDDAIEGDPIDTEASSDAFVFGAYVGYNYRASENIVVGAELGLSASTEDQVLAASDGDRLTIDPRYSFDLSARAGYLVTDRALVYVRGGYANQRVRTTLDDVRISESLDGWHVGGGVEYAITENISARAEYRYSDFGQDGGDYERHQGLIGVSYNF